MLCQPVKLKRLILLSSWQSEDKGSGVRGRRSAVGGRRLAQNAEPGTNQFR